MKICFISPTLGKGGLERVISVLSKEFVELNHEVTIITLTSNKISYNIDQTINIYNLNNESNLSILDKLTLPIKLTKQLHKIKPDIVLAFSETFNPISLIAARALKLKIILFDRSSPLLARSWRDNILRSLTYKHANGIVIQTSIAKSIYQKEFPNSRIFILPNPLIEFKNNDLRSNNKVIISTGRLIKSKNHKELIDIFCSINNKEWKLIIIGEGSERENLDNQIKKSNLSSNISLVGEANDLETYYKKASIFAYTSLSEGFPNAVNEAMAYPLATISYDCIAGISDLIKDNYNGYKVTPGDKTTFKNKLSILMNDEHLRYKFMKNSFQNRVKYNKRIISLQLIGIIKTCLK